MRSAPADLFNFTEALPEGLTYDPYFIAPDEERLLVREFEGLPLREFDFHGYLGKRRVVSFGWRYDYGQRAIRPAEPIPDFLIPLRTRAAEHAGLSPQALQQVLVTEYQPGAGIGWHRDKAVFGDVIGISLLSPCPLRFRRAAAGGWERRTLTVAPRSIYVLRGPARHEWEHSIPAMRTLRYSVTFRQYPAG